MENLLNDNELGFIQGKLVSMLKFQTEQFSKNIQAHRTFANLKAIWPEMYFYESDTSTFDPSISLRAKKLDDITPVIRYITNVCGFHQKEEKKQEGLTITWNFEKFTVKVNFDGSYCKMVKTGEKHIEEKIIPAHTEDVLEMVCGEKDGNQ